MIGNLEQILHVNDDVLAESSKQKARELIQEAKGMSGAVSDPAAVDSFIEKAPLRAAKIFPKKSYPVLREYADILAVAFSVAFGIRALYLQPFKIPTSSMQPTLFGIHYVQKDSSVPNLQPFVNYWIYSARKAYLEVKRDGRFDLNSIRTYNSFLILPRTKFRIGDTNYDLPGDSKQILGYAMKVKDDTSFVEMATREYKEGEILCDGWQVLGDHLFVDRFSLHFREPHRGDVTVFVTEDLPCRDRGYFYIKRLIGMPGDTLKILNGEVHVKEQGAERFMPISSFGIKELNRVYSWKGGYHGHTPVGRLANLAEIEVPEDSYFMMGDNSSNSSDSREWGFVPRRNIIGRALFVFWPFSRRWGIVDRNEPLEIPSSPGLPQMELQ